MIYTAKAILNSAMGAEFNEEDINSQQPMAYFKFEAPMSVTAYKNNYTENVTFADEVALFKNVVYKGQYQATTRLGFSHEFANLVRMFCKFALEELSTEYQIQPSNVICPFTETSMIAFVKVPEYLESVIEGFHGNGEKLEAHVRVTIWYRREDNTLGCTLQLQKLLPLSNELVQSIKAVKNLIKSGGHRFKEEIVSDGTIIASPNINDGMNITPLNTKKQTKQQSNRPVKKRANFNRETKAPEPVE